MSELREKIQNYLESLGDNWDAYILDRNKDVIDYDTATDHILALVREDKDAYWQGRMKALWNEVVCPLCYRLNPQHETADRGKGCHWCQDKEDWMEQSLKEKYLGS